MEVRNINTKQALREILSVFGIEKLSEEKELAIMAILTDLERIGKWKGVRNYKNWVAEIGDPMTLTIDEDYIFNKKRIN